MIDTAQLTGRWIGEPTNNDDVRTWHMLVQGPWVSIEQYDAAQVCIDRLDGVISDYDPPFAFGLKVIGMRTVVLDIDHLLIQFQQAHETASDADDGVDVMFSRPGLSELTAEQAYRRYTSEFRGPARVLFITRWVTT